MLNLGQFEGHSRGGWTPDNCYIGDEEDRRLNRFVMAGDLSVCQVYGDRDKPAEKNAILIASAPSLLEELKLMRELVKRQDDLIEWLDGGALIGDAKLRLAITTLKERLGV